MAAAAAIGSGTHLNRALKDFLHNFPHNCQHIFLERFQKSSGVLVGLPAVAGYFGVGCLDTEYFCTDCFGTECFGTECFCTEYFVAGYFVAGCFGAECVCAGCFVAGCFGAECVCAGYFVAGCFVAGCFCTEYFVAGCFCTEYVFAERSDSDLLVESSAIVPELD